MVHLAWYENPHCDSFPQGKEKITIASFVPEPQKLCRHIAKQTDFAHSSLFQVGFTLKINGNQETGNHNKVFKKC